MFCVSGQISQYEKEKFNKLWRKVATTFISHKLLFSLLCASQNETKVSNAERGEGKEFPVRTSNASGPPIPLVITFSFKKVSQKAAGTISYSKAGDVISEGCIFYLEKDLNPEPVRASSAWKVHQPEVEQVMQS